MTAECDVHKIIFLPGLFMVLITTSCLSANLDKETKTFISFVIESVNKDASFFCNGPFFCDTTWKTCHHYSWHFTHIRLRCHFISAKEPGTESQQLSPKVFEIHYFVSVTSFSGKLDSRAQEKKGTVYMYSETKINAQYKTGSNNISLVFLSFKHYFCI